MGEEIRQHPIRNGMGGLLFLGATTLLLVKGGARFFADVDSRTENLFALGAAALVIALLTLRLRMRFPNFALTPSDLQAIERSGKVYRLHLASGEIHRVYLTGGPGREGTAHQLLRVLPGSMLSSASVSTAATGAALAGATGSWQPLDRSQAFAELRAIAEGTPAPETHADREPDPGRSPSTHTMSAPSTSAATAPDRGSPAPVAATDTAERPARRQIEQWDRDDEYAEELLAQRGVRQGSLVGLRLLTWALMLGSFYFLANDDDDVMGTVFGIWAVALVVGLIRGALVDARAANGRQVVLDAMGNHPQFASRGMPAPWVKAARYTPCGIARMSRAALRLLFVFFLIGLSAVWEESNLTGTIIIAIILAVIAGVWGWLSWFIRRREKRNRDAADAFAGPRLYWIDNPERLQHIADGPAGVA
ncbi:MAG TPA: hypothetical protein VK098_03310 [Beutenbergiaceae bacterium]|nr:hypothetical protein [Beutenbergiaceae bacterium]